MYIPNLINLYRKIILKFFIQFSINVNPLIFSFYYMIANNVLMYYSYNVHLMGIACCLLTFCLNCLLTIMVCNSKNLMSRYNFLFVQDILFLGFKIRQFIFQFMRHWY